MNRLDQRDAGTGHSNWYQVGPRFVFKTTLMLRGINSTKCSDILVHIEMHHKGAVTLSAAHP